MASLGHRCSALTLSLLVTASVVIALLTLGRPTSSRPAEARVITTFDLAADAPSDVRPAPSQAPVTASAPLPSEAPPSPSPPVLPSLVLQDGTVRRSETCDVTGRMQTALQQSVTVQSALRAVPATRRSVANAIMLWDGAWRDADGPLALAVHEAVSRVILDVSTGPGQDCEAQAQTGPQLFFLSDGSASTVLVVGSGRWRWQDVIATAPSESGPATAAPPPPTTARYSSDHALADNP